MISAVTRIADKVNRLQNLSVRGRQVSDESVRDTLLDLANYAVMSVIELDLLNENTTQKEETTG